MSEVTGQVLAAPAGWPDPPDPAAWRGMAGAIAEAVAPHTEADPVAVPAQLLVDAGANHRTGSVASDRGHPPPPE